MGADYQPVSQEAAPSTAPVSVTLNLTDERTDEQNAQTIGKVEALQMTLVEVHNQMRRSAVWVYYMILVQVVVSCYFTDNLAFILNLVANLMGFAGIYKRNRVMISCHFGYTIGMHCLAWFIVFYTMFYNATWAMLALAFCIVQAMGLRHERNLLRLMAVAPVVLFERVAAQQEEQKQQEQSVELQTQPAQQQQPTQVQPTQPAMPSFMFTSPYGQFPVSAEQQAAYYPNPAAFPGYYPAPYPFYAPQQQQQAFYAAQQQQQEGAQQQQPQQAQTPVAMFAPMPVSPYLYYPPANGAVGESEVALDQ